MGSSLTMTLFDGTHTITIDQPLFGYKSMVGMALKIEPKYGEYSLWDNGPTRDIFATEVRTLFDAADQLEFLQMIKDTDFGRAAQLTMTLTAGRGFFPFSPLKGDAGAFGVFIDPEDFVQEGSVGHPTDRFPTVFKMFAQSFPGYALPAETGTGSFQIGDSTGTPVVSNIRFPQNYPQPLPSQNQNLQVTMDGTGKALDFGESSDLYDAIIPLWLEGPKAAAVLDYLVGTIRDGEFSVIAPANTYLFGRDKGASGTYKVTLAKGGQNFELEHVEYNDFRFELKVNWRETL